MTTHVIHATEAAQEAGAAVAVASLPVSFADSGTIPAVLLISGEEDWCEKASDAARTGTRVAVVMEPSAESRIRPLPIPVIVDSVYSSNAAVPSIAAYVARADVRALLEIRAFTGGSATLQAGLLSLLILLRSIAGSGLSVPVLTVANSQGLTLQGRLDGGRPVLITVTVTDAVPESAMVRVIDAQTTLDATIPTTAAARPALISVSDVDGARLLPTIWETSHRASLRRAEDILSSAVPGDDLAALAADVELTRQLLRHTPTN